MEERVWGEVYLDRDGSLFRLGGGRLLPIPEEEICQDTNSAGLLRKLRLDPFSSFYMTPFYKVVYASGHVPLGDFRLTPGDFNPGSPFDAICAAHEYVAHQKLYFPRMYLYPTSACNSNCKLCQFHERHREPTSLQKDEMIKALQVLRRHKGGIRVQSLIVSGDGEPLVYEHLPELLRTASRMDLRIFLTTNLLKPYRSNKALYEAITQTCSMVTVSVKGLSPEAYAEQQGLKGNRWFEQVMDNLAFLFELRGQLQKEESCLIGVASLILPENSRHYRSMIDKLHGMGADYFYLNQVEPSAEKWGIAFSEEEQRETMRQLAEYGRSPYCGFVVRCAANPFSQRHGGTVYYDAAGERAHPDICGSALFNPLVLSDGGKAKWLACRNGDLFSKEAFRFETADGEVSQASVDKVMGAASCCHTCRLERQVKHFDKMIGIERGGIQDLQYYLVFDADKILSGAYDFINFEDVVK